MSMPPTPYTLTHQTRKNSWVITFTIPEPFHTLSPFTQVVDTLLKHLPIIMECECDNGCGFSFANEVPHTETGHLFEHILLEYLCQQKLAAGYERAEFCGRTSWNWHKEKRGIFHITIPKKPEDDLFFYPALEQSLNLLQTILASPSQVAGKQPRAAGLNSNYLYPVYASAGYVAA